MHVYDVLIIGAGPCGLGIAARLRENTPSATFTDDEHQRYHWIRKHGRRMNIKNHKTGVDSLSPTPSYPGICQNCGDEEEKGRGPKVDMLVLDAAGPTWMARWRHLFQTFGIRHLRSPMFFHIDPADRDSLVGYAYEKARESDLQPLPGCVGKEVSKHRQKKQKKKRSSAGRMSQGGPDVDERDRKDYFTPSSDLFEAHCDEVAQRYRIRDGLIKQEQVANIEYDDISRFLVDDDSEHLSTSTESMFRVTTDRGVHFARIVVLAVGPGNAPFIPRVPGLQFGPPHESYCHSMQIESFPPSCMTSGGENRAVTNMLIVGGGLTSVQLADLAIKRGVDKVWLLMRGPVKVKYFDIELDWVGKFRNGNQAAFWSADTEEERWEMMSQARNGGSITPRYRKILDAHVKTGKISLHTHTTLSSLEWSAESRTWTTVTTSPAISIPPIKFIVFATGIQSNVSTIPFLQSLHQKYPIDLVGGLPCLTDDLMWRDDVPLFVTGRLAGLRLGPGAPNLVGARVGAERIAWNINDLLEKILGKKSDGKGKSVNVRDEGLWKLEEFAAGRTNRFDSLTDVSEAV